MVPDRVEIDQGGGPGGLEAGFRRPQVAGFAGFVAVGEQAEQPLDPRPGAAQVFGGLRVVQGLAGGDQRSSSAAYNAGPSSVARCGCIPPYPETRAYVAKILGLLGGAGDLLWLADGGLEVRLVE